MKVLVVLLGLIAASLHSGKRTWDCWEGGKERVGLRSDCGVPSTQLTGVASVTVRIRVYNATGELDITGATGVLQRKDTFVLGTRVLLTCNVTELPEGHEIISYRWFRNCTGGTQGRCQIHNRDPYYRVVNSTLLVDVTSWDHGGTYTCFVMLNITSGYSTPSITVTGYYMHHKYCGQLYTPLVSHR